MRSGSHYVYSMGKRVAHPTFKVILGKIPCGRPGVCRRIPSSARERAVFRLARTAKQAISVYIVDAAGRSPVGQQAARSQIGFSDRLLGRVNLCLLLADVLLRFRKHRIANRWFSCVVLPSWACAVSQGAAWPGLHEPGPSTLPSRRCFLRPTTERS